MIKIRRAEDRGYADYGWLKTYHTFSFANYYDPNYLGFRALRVINEDRVLGGNGFGTHGHRDMEIITYVLEGGLEHRDSLGNGSVIYPGEVQRMSAGKGILHSEYNSSGKNLVHLLQIWIVPNQKGLTPSYEQKKVDIPWGKLQLIASPEAEEGSVRIHQDVKIYAGKLAEGDRLSYSLGEGRYAWLQIAAGTIALNGLDLANSDGAAISQETELNIVGKKPAEILLFDLA